MAGHGGGAWKVAYADFTTAMMAFFLVMWITSQNPEVKEAVANHFRNPFGTFDSGGSILPPLPKPSYEESPPSLETEHAPDAGSADRQSRHPYVVRLNNGDRTIVGTMIVFRDDSAELDAAAVKDLRRLVPMLAGKPQKIEIRGHASRRPPKAGLAPQDPWQLSYTRCLRTLAFLESQGIKPERVRLSQAGPFEPYTVPPEAQRLTHESRVEIFMLNETAHDPLDAGKMTLADSQRPPEPHGQEPAQNSLVAGG